MIVEGPTWQEAEANANKLGGHLVTINDAEENAWIVDNLAGYSYYYEEGANWTPTTSDGKDYFKDQYWIGFTRNGANFSWADGTSWNYSNFGSGEPALNGDYGEITLAPKNADWSKIAGKWNDENKDHPHYGIAEIKLDNNNNILKLTANSPQAVTVAQVNQLSALTTGVVTATISDGDMATLAGLTETGNAYTVTVSDSSVAASALNTLDSKTTVAVDATAVTSITGTAADINTTYTSVANGAIAGLGNEAVTISDANLLASSLNAVDAFTTGMVDATAVTSITGTAADINTAYTSNAAGTITGLGNEAVTITDMSIDASILITLDAHTTGLVNTAAVTTITGSYAEIVAAYAGQGQANRIVGLGNEAITVTGSVTVTQANTVAALTTGAVTATISTGSFAGAGNLAELIETGNAYTVTVTDTTATAVNLTNLDAKTTVALDSSAVTTITGTAAEINTVYAAGANGTITGLGNEAVTLSDTSIDASVLITLDAFTTGRINASSITTLTGSAPDQAIVRGSSGISGLPGNITFGAFSQIGSDIDGEAAGDVSGFSVSLSDDGTIVAIGAPSNDGNGNSSGHVSIYKNTNGTWTQIGSDIDGEAAGDSSGHSVSLSADGTIVAIGALYNDSNTNYSQKGHVRIYKNVNNTWTKIGNDIDGDSAGGKSGYSVSLSANGNVVAIGAPLHGTNGNVRIYQNINGNWTKVGDDIDEGFRNSLSLSADGNVIAIGGYANDGQQGIRGTVRIYQNINGNWTQIGSDIDGEAANDFSGQSISLSSDGSIVAIGAECNSGNGFQSGHVRIFKNNNGTWTQIGSDIDGEAPSEFVGASVSLSSDGTVVAVGAPFHYENGPGLVRVYQNVNDTWTKVSEDIVGEANGDLAGYSLSLSADGTTVAIGAQKNDGNGTNSGHVRIFQNINNKNFLTANFNFDNETKFSDLGINIDASFSTSSSTSTWIYGENTARYGFTDLNNFQISSEALTNLFSNKAKNLEENEIGIIKNQNDTYSIIKIIDSKKTMGDGDDIDGVTLNYGYLEKDLTTNTYSYINTIPQTSSSSEFSISDLKVIEGESGKITISRSGLKTSIQNLTLVSNDGTAIAGSDYLAINKTITFAEGESSKTVDISLIEDTLKESNETFSLTLSASNSDNTPAQIVDGNAIVTITDDDYDEQDLLTASFNFDYETKFSDLGINIDARFSTSSSTSTWIYGENTAKYGFTDLSNFQISSEALTNLFSNQAKTLQENEIGIIKNQNDTYSIIKIIDSKRRWGDGDDIDGVTLNYGYLEKDLNTNIYSYTNTSSSLTEFQALRYIASNPDLINVFGINITSAISHYNNHGKLEGRSIATFSASGYLAKYSDLSAAFGNDETLALKHYIQSGYAEGRTYSSSGSGSGSSSASLSEFEALRYIASNPDLINIFGININSAISHYDNYGNLEGRSITTFSASGYLAKYSDLSTAFGNDETLALKHYIQIGYAEGRTYSSSGEGSGSSSSEISYLSDFQALNYIASNLDLISVLGNNIEAAKSHYINYGKSEGRTVDGFDEWGYLASNTDLITALGSNAINAIEHYISFGKSEGRSTNIFNAASYLNNYSDLANAFGNDHTLATKHYVESGFNEGRFFK